MLEIFLFGLEEEKEEEEKSKTLCRQDCCGVSCFLVCVCVSVFVPVGLEVAQSSLQVIEQVDFLTALRTVDIQQLTVVQLLHLLRSLSRTARTKNYLLQ